MGAKIFFPRLSDFLKEFRQSLELVLIVNVYVTLHWFSIQIFYAVLKEAAIKRLS